MAINFNGITPNSAGTSRTKSAEPDLSMEKNEQSSSSKVDNSVVSLSEAAKHLQKVEDEIKAMPIVDQSKVDSIKTAIKNGEYEIDYDRLASAFMKFEAEG